MVCISLVISDVELPFSVLLSHLYVFFVKKKKKVYSDPLSIFKLDCSLDVVNSSWVLDINLFQYYDL